MATDLSRRTLLRGIGAGTVTTLLRERLALVPFLGAAGFGLPRTGEPAMELTLTAVSENTLS